MNPRRLLLPLSILLILSAAPTVQAQASPEALRERAGRVVSALGLGDPAHTERVRDLVARQYADLQPIHAARDAALRTARTAPDSDAATKRARDEAQARLAELHYAFLGRLAAELTPAQIDQVKDGMTYGVVPLTFRVYQQMLPELTPAQKAQLYAWLIEAREHAMDGGSSEEKHGVFGKYKGRINNYLSAAGYNMKDAEKNLRPKS